MTWLAGIKQAPSLAAEVLVQGGYEQSCQRGRHGSNVPSSSVSSRPPRPVYPLLLLNIQMFGNRDRCPFSKTLLPSTRTPGLWQVDYIRSFLGRTAITFNHYLFQLWVAWTACRYHPLRVS